MNYATSHGAVNDAGRPPMKCPSLKPHCANHPACARPACATTRALAHPQRASTGSAPKAAGCAPPDQSRPGGWLGRAQALLLGFWGCCPPSYIGGCLVVLRKHAVAVPACPTEPGRLVHALSCAGV